jgi:hypothetical protein
MTPHLAQIAARLKAATPGPMKAIRAGLSKAGEPWDYALVVVKEQYAVARIYDPALPSARTEQRQWDNARFFAHAPTDIPYLLELVAAQERVIEARDACRLSVIKPIAEQARLGRAVYEAESVLAALKERA